jgi:hypothetical protein
MKEVVAMIGFILEELRRQPGVVIPDAAGTAAMVRTCETYGGERLYVPKLPKLQTAVRVAGVARHGTGTQQDLADAAGVSVETVRRMGVRVRRRG